MASQERVVFGGMGGGMQICRGFTSGHWQALRLRISFEADSSRCSDEDFERYWEQAIEVFSRRLKERYLLCIDALEAADGRSDVDPDTEAAFIAFPHEERIVPGFAIIAVCCPLLETLAQFAEGGRRSTSALIRKFLERPAFNGEFQGQAGQRFYDGIRNGLLHETQTRQWLIRRDDPRDAIVGTHKGMLVLNRTMFTAALRQEFSAYLADLRTPENGVLRKHFLRKMDEIAYEIA